ncbi:uncharacterized protein LOC141902852 [Tubulanus polymorphus]|uniref:uncharacterized protein LOC141902852 n=1 Tax=Tubulanus polymorphus TaxID=672921 RepID=UPI003DA4E421
MPFPEEAYLHATKVTNLAKWSPYFQGFTPEGPTNPSWEEFSEWRFPDEETGYRRMAESLGFTVKRCTVSLSDYVFPDHQSAKGMISSILPHSQRIPDFKLQEFMDDVLEMYLERCPLDENGKIHHIKDMLVVHLENKPKL